MPNNYFEFKQFRINQDKCSMKVCTDACIFGSWIAEKVVSCKMSVANVLDIGSGTGLLSLMYAQKNLKARIDAIEIEENAFIQTKENFKNSKWNKRLKAFHYDIKLFIPDKKYDLIISNPPFYENDFLSNKQDKNIAKHDAGLNLNELISVVKNNLTNEGYFAVLLPYQRIKYFEDLIEENKFFLNEKLLLKQTRKHNYFRGILFFSYNQSTIITKELIIKNDEGNYTDEFNHLLKDYYLNL